MSKKKYDSEPFDDRAQELAVLDSLKQHVQQYTSRDIHVYVYRAWTQEDDEGNKRTVLKADMDIPAKAHDPVELADEHGDLLQADQYLRFVVVPHGQVGNETMDDAPFSEISRCLAMAKRRVGAEDRATPLMDTPKGRGWVFLHDRR